MDPSDKLGKALQSFDDVFDNEREKESYYIELMLRRLSSTTVFDDFKSCRTTRHLSIIRHLLDTQGEEKKLPGSSVRVDEDFHYMRGKYGCNDGSLSEKGTVLAKQVNIQCKKPRTPSLNATLSMTCKDDIRIENLKECLFEDPFLSRSKFFEFRRNRKDSWFTNYDQHFCCECEYIRCTHFDDATDLKRSSRNYYAATCQFACLR